MCDAKALLDHKDSNTIRTRWVITNKGDIERPDIRARLVAQEVNTYKSDEFFASTPPLESKRLLLSHMATQRRLPDGRALEASFIDIKKRRTSMESPEGDCICFCHAKWAEKKAQWLYSSGAFMAPEMPE